jgi:hypothetical protein
MSKLECTLIQLGNERYIELAFNRPLADRAFSLSSYSFDDEKAPVKIVELKKHLTYLSLGARVGIDTGAITFETRGPWSYFLPQVIEYLHSWWKEEFTIVYDDQRPSYDIFDEGGYMGGQKRVPRNNRAIDYGVEFKNPPVETQSYSLGFIK